MFATEVAYAFWHCYRLLSLKSDSVPHACAVILRTLLLHKFIGQGKARFYTTPSSIMSRAAKVAELYRRNEAAGGTLLTKDEEEKLMQVCLNFIVCAPALMPQVD